MATEIRFPKPALLAGLLVLSIASACSATPETSRAEPPVSTLPPAPPGTAAEFGTGLSG